MRRYAFVGIVVGCLTACVADSSDRAVGPPELSPTEGVGSAGLTSGAPQDPLDSEGTDGPVDSVGLDSTGEDGLTTGGDDAWATDTGEACVKDLDIVFVIDATSTMGGFIAAVGAAIGDLDATIATLNLPSPPQYGLVVFADDFGWDNEGAPYADLGQLEADFASWQLFTEQDQQIGPGPENYTAPENSLDALFASAGFAWRPADTTTRVVIHATDDTFWDGPGTFNDVPVEHDYAQTLEGLWEAQARVFSFAAQTGGFCECEDVGDGWFTPYQGQVPIPEGTGGQTFAIESIVENPQSFSQVVALALEEVLCEPYVPVG